MAKPIKSKPEVALGWLGRQIGHLTKAVKTDVKSGAKSDVKQPAPAPPPKPTKPPAKAKVVYRDNKVEEVSHPTEPGVKLRRTVIDEVIVDPKKRID